MECIILYDALHKRIAYLDALVKGLEVLGVKNLISHFPEVLKPAFVSKGTVGATDVRRLLQPNPSTTEMDEKQHNVWQYLLSFIEGANHAGI